MQIKVLLLTILGFFFLGLGAVGLILPVWPTTPFVLLSATCFTCTPNIRRKIMRIEFFREHIENYETRGGLSKKTVTISLSYLWIMLILSMVLVGELWLTALLTFIGTSVTAHILYMARARKSKDSDRD